MGYYFLLVMIKLPYEQGRTRSLNKIEICFSPARCPKESSPDVLGSSPCHQGPRLPSLCSLILGVSFRRQQEEVGAKESGRTE